MIRRPPRSTLDRSSAASDVYKRQGDALPGVNVIIKGTYFGTATDLNGKFKLNNISAGTYNIDISLIGYKTVQYTGFEIESGKTKSLEVKLEETVPVSYTHLRAHETVLDIVCRLLLEKKNKTH